MRDHDLRRSIKAREARIAAYKGILNDPEAILAVAYGLIPPP